MTARELNQLLRGLFQAREAIMRGPATQDKQILADELEQCTTLLRAAAKRITQEQELPVTPLNISREQRLYGLRTHAQYVAQWMCANESCLLSDLQEEFSDALGVPWCESPLWSMAFKLYGDSYE